MRTIILTAAFAALTVSQSAGTASDAPLVARNLVTGSSSHVELANTGSRAATAWSIAITTKNPNGGIHRVIHTSDAYLAEVTRGLPRSPEHLDWIRPGQSRQIPLDPQPADASVQVFAVVLDDATAIGDPQAIASIFEHRAAERDSLKRVVDAFQSVLAAKKGTAALEDLRTRLRRAPETPADKEPTPERSAREAVDQFLKQAAQNEDQADASLRQYAAFVQRQYDLAVKHAQPKM